MDERQEEIIDSSEYQKEFMDSLDQLEEIKEGQLIDGKVVQLDSEYVYVDVGLKSEGKISRSKFDDDELPKVGETLEVSLEKLESKNGSIIVSKDKADALRFKKVLKVALENDEPVTGKFVKVVNGGFEVELSGKIRGFCPISKAEIKKTEDSEKLLNLKSEFKILKYEGRNLILSRKDYLQDKLNQARNKFFETIQEGDVVKGRVKSFTSFGAFIDLGGFDGLLHINDMKWGHVSRPKDYVKKNDEIDLIVLALDPKEKRINLSLKHFTPDPWLSFEEKFKIDDTVKGRITKLIEYGAFIEIEDGIEGFVHISELSWVKRIKHPKEILSVGDEVEAKILDFDADAQRISLGIKQTKDNPWDTIAERYKIGDKITGPIVNITKFGAFVTIEDGIDGFVHIEDLSWTNKIKNVNFILKEGEEKEFIILDIDLERYRIRLGLKQLTDDPWGVLSQKYGKFSEMEGVITSITDFGLFVKVEGNIEGLISVYQIPNPEEKEDLKELLKNYKEGDKIKCAVLDIDSEKKRLSLSIKALEMSQQRKEMSKYIHNDDQDEPTASLADFIK